MSEPKPKMPVSAEQRLANSRGGRIGGKSRAESLTPERRKEIARKAAEKRWGRVSESATDENILHDRKKL